MLKKSFGDGGFFRIRFAQGSIDLVKTSQLEVANRAYSVALVESCPECPLRHFGRGRELPDVDALTFVLLEPSPRSANDLASRKLGSP